MSNPKADRLAQARALKERCYASWHADPAELQRCAIALDALAADAPDDAAGAEVRALALWTAAIADLVEARIARAVQRLDEAHAAFTVIGRTADAAQTRVPKVIGLSLLGRFDAAIDCADVARRELLAQGDRLAAAKVLLNSGSLCMQRDRYREATRHYREAGELFAALGDDEHRLLAEVGQADALSYLGSTGEAESLYRRALEHLRAHSFPVIEAAVVQALAEIALARGDYAGALTGLAQASQDFARLGLPLPTLEADKTLADTYLELRLLPEADALYASVLARLDDHEAAATRAWVWLHRARLRAARGQPAPAREALERAEQLFAGMDSSPGRAAALLARSELALAAGDADAARSAATDALQQMTELHLPLQAAQLARAEAMACNQGDEALVGFDGLLSAPQTSSAVRERAWLGRGRLLRAAGRTEDARHAFEQAVELAEAARQGLPGDDFRRSYLDQRVGAYEELLRLALDAHERACSAQSAWTVLRALERRRARTLRERLGPAAVRRERQTEPEEVRALRARLDWLHRRLNRFMREGDALEQPAALNAERLRLEQQLLEHERRARLTGAAQALYAGAADGALDGGTLLATLGPRVALVTYAELDDELFALSLVAGRLKLHRCMARWSQVQSALRAWRTQVATQELGRERLDRHAALLAERARGSLARLHALVWQPLTNELQGVESVRIVPCGALGGLPFAALWDGSAHLVENLQTSIAISVESALQTRPPERIRKVVAIADTLRLPGVIAEVAALNRHWSDASLHIGAEATRDALDSEASAADLLHLACHAEFRGDSPLFSALHLQGGTLTALDAERLPLSAQIVVLSGCETALSDAARDDEALGLARAFLIAGARCVLGGLWAIEDAATAGWMSAFHQCLASGSLPALALAQTQRQCIARGESPFLWAAFALRGGA